MQILARAIIEGHYPDMREEVGRKVRNNQLSINDIVFGLKKGGNIPEYDGTKVARMIEESGFIDHGRFNSLIDRAFIFARDKSTPLKVFQDKFATNAQQLCRNFEMRDHNKDGLLDIEGFSAVCLIPEINLSQEQIREVFSLIANY